MVEDRDGESWTAASSEMHSVLQRHLFFSSMGEVSKAPRTDLKGL